uniref:Uncharacterized protein n=1 Tax=Anguilla anguilla TaxID=7936 RepID=A0A0E9VAM8_ANGAN
MYVLIRSMLGKIVYKCR